MRKKKLLVFLLLVAVCFSQVHAKEKQDILFGNTQAGMPAYDKNTSLIDLPLSGGITQFAVAIYDFNWLVIRLITLFAFLAIVFNAFKLWAGTMELKKVYVDLVYKFTMCIVLLHIYIPVTDKLIQVATQLGASVAGGYKKIDNVYTEAYAALTEDISKGLEEYKTYIAGEIAQSIKNGKAEKDANGKIYISDSVIKNLQAYGMSAEAAQDWAKQHNLNTVHLNVVEEDDYDSYGVYLGKKTVDTYLVDENGNKIKEKGWFFSTRSKIDSIGNKADKKFDSKKQLMYMSKINALNTVMAGENRVYTEAEDPDKAFDRDKETSLGVLKNVFFSPWLQDKNNANTLFLSPSRLIKVCNLMADAIAFSSAYQMDEMTGDLSETKFNPRGEWGIHGIFAAIQSFLFKIGMVICVVICMAEYTITILEFYLVRAVATMLIPMLFVDSVKSYAQNILKIFIQYFFKVVIIVMGCFFALGLFIDVSVAIFQKFDVGNSQTLVLYISTLVTGLLFALNAAKITNTLLSGQPSLGVGEIAHGMRAALNGAHQVGVAGHNIKQAAGGVANLGRGVAQNVGSAASTFGSALDSGQKAASARAAELRGETKWDKLDDREKGIAEGMINSDARSAGRSAFFRSLASAAGQKAKQGLYKAATGRDMQFFDKEGRLRDQDVDKDGNIVGTGKALTLGQKFIDKDGQQRAATLEDVRRSNNERMEAEQKKALAKRKSAVQFGDDLEDKLHHKTSI